MVNCVTLRRVPKSATNVVLYVKHVAKTVDRDATAPGICLGLGIDVVAPHLRQVVGDQFDVREAGFAGLGVPGAPDAEAVVSGELRREAGDIRDCSARDWSELKAPSVVFYTLREPIACYPL